MDARTEPYVPEAWVRLRNGEVVLKWRHEGPTQGCSCDFCTFVASLDSEGAAPTSGSKGAVEAAVEGAQKRGREEEEEEEVDPPEVTGALRLYTYEELEEKWPHHAFKSMPDGSVRRKSGGQWRKFCFHGKVQRYCPTCTPRSHCKHFVVFDNCTKCNPRLTCQHGIRRRSCITCSPWSFCIHDILKQYCIPCEGSAMCEHKTYRHVCKPCGGKGYCHVHDIVLADCKICKGTSICPCGEYYITDAGLCNHCNPDYIPGKVSASKVSCAYLDSLEQCLGISIQHVHMDKIARAWTGVEHRPTEWRKKPIDGFCVASDGTKNAIEFHGDCIHGHPRLWGDTEQNRDRFGRLYKDLFYKTEKYMQKLAAYGYHVSYVWECDANSAKGKENPVSVLREFNGTLEWE